MKILGLDVGGANLKFAVVSFDNDAPENLIDCGETFFPFWTDHEHFGDELTRLHESIQHHAIDAVAVTITAELADCFASKRQGIDFIVDEIENAFGNSPCRYYSTQGKLNNASVAKSNWSETAASNWHASAWFLFEKHQLSDGFLVDIGSTTTDIIAVRDRLPVSSGATDLDRLKSGQLLYAGVGRTPICSLIDEVILDGTRVSLARELFATMADAIAWHQKKSSDDTIPTADGRSRSIESCRSRLCRMLCADDDQLEDNELDQMADQCVSKLLQLVKQNLLVVARSHPKIASTFIIVGAGKWLAKPAIEQAFADRCLESSANSTDHARIVEPFADCLASQVVPAMAVAARYHFEQRTEQQS